MTDFFPPTMILSPYQFTLVLCDFQYKSETINNTVVRLKALPSSFFFIFSLFYNFSYILVCRVVVCDLLLTASVNPKRLISSPRYGVGRVVKRSRMSRAP